MVIFLLLLLGFSHIIGMQKVKKPDDVIPFFGSFVVFVTDSNNKKSPIISENILSDYAYIGPSDELWGKKATILDSPIWKKDVIDDLELGPALYQLVKNKKENYIIGLTQSLLEKENIQMRQASKQELKKIITLLLANKAHFCYQNSSEMIKKMKRKLENHKEE